MLRRSIVSLSLALLATAAAVPAAAQQQWKMGSLMQPPTFGATQDDELLATIGKSTGGKLSVEPPRQRRPRSLPAFPQVSGSYGRVAACTAAGRRAGRDRGPTRPRRSGT
jgi:hypothetical protein